jgi:hypothetical protein
MTDIPTLGLPHEMPAIRNSDDLCLRWRALMGPLGFSRPRLWIAFLEPDNMMTAPLMQTEDIPRTADSGMCGSLLEMCRHVVGRNGVGESIAMLLTRPGRLTSAADHLSVSMWPVHFANDVEVRVFAPDDLVRSGLMAGALGIARQRMQERGERTPAQRVQLRDMTCSR